MLGERGGDDNPDNPDQGNGPAKERAKEGQGMGGLRWGRWTGQEVGRGEEGRVGGGKCAGDGG